MSKLHPVSLAVLSAMAAAPLLSSGCAAANAQTAHTELRYMVAGVRVDRRRRDATRLRRIPGPDRPGR